MSTTDAHLIVDLEATCWRTGTKPNRMETIEIGAVKLSGSSLHVDGEFSTLVRPMQEPLLSQLCTELTSITQSEVDAASTFPEALATFVAWVGDAPVVFCSWGDYDHGQIVVDCRRHRLPLPPLLDRHVNLKNAFAGLQGIKPCGMKRALTLLGVEAQGAHHRALDDARNIAKITQFVLPQLDGEDKSG